MSESKLRFLESELNTSKETAAVVNGSHQRMWLWRKGVGSLSAEEQATLEKYLLNKVSRLNSVVAVAAPCMTAA